MLDVHPPPTVNEYLMAIEAWNINKMPFKSDNPLLDMILSQKKTQLINKISTKLPIFTIFDLRYALKMNL